MIVALRRVFWVAVVLLLLPSVLRAHSVDEVVVPKVDSVVELTNRGVAQLYLHGDMEQAQADLESALSLDSLYAPAHYTLSQMLMPSDLKRSTEHALAAYQSDSSNVWYLDNYGRALLSGRDFDQAQRIYEYFVELQPRDANGYRLLSILYQRTGEMQRAISLLDTAELRVGYNPYLMDMKQQLLVATNQSYRAVEQAQALIDEMPYDADLRVSMAELYGTLGRDSLAYSEYLAALKIDSMSINALMSLGGYMSSRGEHGDYLVVLKRLVQSPELNVDEKIELVEEVLEDRQVWQREGGRLVDLVETLVAQYPRDVRVAEVQTNFFIAKGSLEGALSLLKGHIRNDEPHKYYYEMVVDMERYVGRADSAEYYLRRACEVFPDDANFVESLAHTLTYRRSYDEAAEHYQLLLQMVDDSLHSRVWCMIGDMYQLGGFDKQSYRAYDRAIGYDADNDLALNNYAYAISEGESKVSLLKRALTMVERATQLVDGSPTYLDTHGWVLYKLGRYDEAKVVLRRAVSLDAANNSEIALHYGAVLWVLGEDTMANIYWERAEQWGAESEQIADSRAEAEQRRGRFDKSR